MQKTPKRVKVKSGIEGLTDWAGMRDTHAAPHLVGEMAELGVVAGVLRPSNRPLASRHGNAYLDVVTRYEPLSLDGSVHGTAGDPLEQSRMLPENTAQLLGGEPPPAA